MQILAVKGGHCLGKTGTVGIDPVVLTIGNTKGYQRIRNGYSNTRQTSKLVFVQLLEHNSRLLLSGFPLPQQDVTGAPYETY